MTVTIDLPVEQGLDLSSTGPVPGPADERVDLGGLLELVAAGHRDAFSRLYDAVSAKVYGLSRAVLRSSSLAEETTQDVFLEIWQRAACSTASGVPGCPGS